MDDSYLYIIIIMHLSFAGALLIQQRDDRSRFTRLFAISWGVEAFRAAILLPQVHDSGWLRPYEWFLLSEVTCPIATWYLVAACASLADKRLPAWLGTVYVVGSILFVIATRYGFARAAGLWGISEEQGEYWAVFVNLVFLFGPVTAARLVVLVWLVDIWRKTRLGGAIIASAFCVPYAIVALIVPLQYIFQYYPPWVSFLWVFRVFGFSIGLVLLRLSLQQEKLQRQKLDLQELNESLAGEIRDRLAVEERLRSQQELLRHADRLNTLGELVAGIAHELNQPLSAAANYSAVCRRVLEDAPIEDKREQLLDYVEKSEESVLRAGTIIKRLRALASRSQSERIGVNINDVVRATVELLASEMKWTQVKLHLDSELKDVYADEVQLQQVLMNLLKNAKDSLGESEDGCVTVRTWMSDRESHLSVEDNGPGIDESIDDLFSPFVTTKAEGMGIGLAICRSIVEHHGGSIRCRNNAEGGAAFHVTIPLDQERGGS